MIVKTKAPSPFLKTKIEYNSVPKSNTLPSGGPVSISFGNVNRTYDQAMCNHKYAQYLEGKVPETSLFTVVPHLLFP